MHLDLTHAATETSRHVAESGRDLSTSSSERVLLCRLCLNCVCSLLALKRPLAVKKHKKASTRSAHRGVGAHADLTQVPHQRQLFPSSDGVQVGLQALTVHLLEGLL